MTPFTIISKPCAHETQGISHDVDVPDFHPLSYTELKGLIAKAFNSSNFATRARVQCRLVQAIEGHTCPHPIEGPVAAKASEVNSTYVEGLRNGDSGLTDRLAKILNIQP